MKIKIKQEHIDSGKARDCQYCAASLATNDVLNPNYRAISSFWDIWICSNERRVGKPAAIIPTPPNLSEFISDVDAGCHVRPMSFELNIPSHLLRENNYENI